MITDKLRREVDALDNFMNNRLAALDKNEDVDYGIYIAYKLIRNDWLPQIQKELTELEKTITDGEKK